MVEDPSLRMYHVPLNKERYDKSEIDQIILNHLNDAKEACEWKQMSRSVVEVHMWWITGY